MIKNKIKNEQKLKLFTIKFNADNNNIKFKKSLNGKFNINNKHN